ncbi:tRNA (adenosine(37)-N6)-dimethylallyltransferase MiaA [uncultured Phascolarctobacterium sp.]|uniref:tRNA (adenosine(37)-N6)-dimethylallyltransferase MiaA n=1 Tax=uncultured Phascolarctobacterium sp. TaxID=512296 RepID=UPI0025D0D6AE|nr:tRNA (adenosine(37)-N6)-dimethylallyltransferase MiaA [uncultured Phascolarctobacterium sp.]
MKPKVAVILGPTATGKSHCGIELAKRLNGEIISGDSMLVYKKMNIGTAKPTVEELASVPHHLIDILPPEAEFSVVDFKALAEPLIADINNRGKLPIIVGGTGFYIKALLENYEFNTVEECSELRQELEEFAKSSGNAALHAKLRQIDPAAAERLHSNDVRRVIRAIEAAEGGEKITHQKAGKWPYDAVVFGLRMERDVLYARINDRVDKMLADGLVEETKALLDGGLAADALSMRSIGYRQMTWYLQGAMARDAAVDKLKQSTRNFAKRQFTWYRQMPYIKWFDLDQRPDYEKIIDDMQQMLVEKFKLR